MEAGQGGIAQQHVEVDGVGVVDLAQDVLHPLAGGRVVEVARQVDEDRHVALVRVAADEDARLVALLQVDDLHDGLEDLVRRGVEQVLARVGLERTQQLVTRVRVAAQPGPAQDVAHLRPDDRDVQGGRRIDPRGPQPHEAALAHDPAVRVVRLDAHVVHVAATHDLRPRVRLRQHEDVRLLRLRRDLPRQARGPRRPQRGDAQGAALDRVEPLALVVDDERVLAEAQEDEAVVHPREELRGLRRFGGQLRPGCVRPQLVRDLAGAGPHAQAVAVRRDRVLQHVHEPVADAREVLVRDAVDLDVDPGLGPGVAGLSARAGVAGADDRQRRRLRRRVGELRVRDDRDPVAAPHRHDRVVDVADRQALPAQLRDDARDGVAHVRHDDVDEGAVVVDRAVLRVADRDPGGTPLVVAGQFQVRGGVGRERLRTGAADLGARQPGVVLLEEVRRRVLPLLLAPRAGDVSLVDLGHVTLTSCAVADRMRRARQ